MRELTLGGASRRRDAAAAQELALRSTSRRRDAAAAALELTLGNMSRRHEAAAALGRPLLLLRRSAGTTRSQSRVNGPRGRRTEQLFYAGATARRPREALVLLLHSYRGLQHKSRRLCHCTLTNCEHSEFTNTALVTLIPLLTPLGEAVRLDCTFVIYWHRPTVLIGSVPSL